MTRLCDFQNYCEGTWYLKIKDGNLFFLSYPGIASLYYSSCIHFYLYIYIEMNQFYIKEKNWFLSTSTVCVRSEKSTRNKEKFSP